MKVPKFIKIADIISLETLYLYIETLYKLPWHNYNPLSSNMKSIRKHFILEKEIY
jgi:hypothetical protein